jgi:Domain of unknown function (DUF4190)
MQSCPKCGLATSGQAAGIVKCIGCGTRFMAATASVMAHPDQVGISSSGGSTHQGTRSAGLEIATFILGILSLFLGAITGIPGVICGHIALGKCAPGSSGKGMLVTGLVLCYIGLVLSLFGVIAVFLHL